MRMFSRSFAAALTTWLAVVIVLPVGCSKPSSKAEPVAITSAAPSASTAPMDSVASAPPASSAPVDPPPPAPKPPFLENPQTNLQKLLASAVPVADFEKAAEQNAWAIYQPGTTDCPVMGQAPRLDKPDDAVREFDRDKYRGELVDKLVVSWADIDSAKPDDGILSVLSLYNHSAGTFTINVRADAESRWPVLGGSPKFIIDKDLSEVQDVFVSQRGEGFVLTVPRMVPFYLNGSIASFAVKVDADTARKWTENGVPIRYIIVQKFKSLGFHKNCMRVCKRIAVDTVDCPGDKENQGTGMFFVTEPVGYEVYADGKLVAEKQPAGS